MAENKPIDYEDVLSAFNNTLNDTPDATDEELLEWFPEFGNDKSKLEAAFAYRNTKAKNKYNAEELRSKFPEFFPTATVATPAAPTTPVFDSILPKANTAPTVQEEATPAPAPNYVQAEPAPDKTQDAIAAQTNLVGNYEQYNPQTQYENSLIAAAKNKEHAEQLKSYTESHMDEIETRYNETGAAIVDKAISDATAQGKTAFENTAKQMAGLADPMVTTIMGMKAYNQHVTPSRISADVQKKIAEESDKQIKELLEQQSNVRLLSADYNAQLDEYASKQSKGKGTTSATIDLKAFEKAAGADATAEDLAVAEAELQKLAAKYNIDPMFLEAYSGYVQEKLYEKLGEDYKVSGAGEYWVKKFILSNSLGMLLDMTTKTLEQRQLTMQGMEDYAKNYHTFVSDVTAGFAGMITDPTNIIAGVAGSAMTKGVQFAGKEFAGATLRRSGAKLLSKGAYGRVAAQSAVLNTASRLAGGATMMSAFEAQGSIVSQMYQQGKVDWDEVRDAAGHGVGMGLAFGVAGEASGKLAQYLRGKMSERAAVNIGRGAHYAGATTTLVTSSLLTHLSNGGKWEDFDAKNEISHAIAMQLLFDAHGLWNTFKGVKGAHEYNNKNFGTEIPSNSSMLKEAWMSFGKNQSVFTKEEIAQFNSIGIEGSDGYTIAKNLAKENFGGEKLMPKKLEAILADPSVDTVAKIKLMDMLCGGHNMKESSVAYIYPVCASNPSLEDGEWVVRTYDSAGLTFSTRRFANEKDAIRYSQDMTMDLMNNNLRYSVELGSVMGFRVDFEKAIDKFLEANPDVSREEVVRIFIDPEAHGAEEESLREAFETFRSETAVDKVFKSICKQYDITEDELNDVLTTNYRDLNDPAKKIFNDFMKSLTSFITKENGRKQYAHTDGTPEGNRAANAVDALTREAAEDGMIYPVQFLGDRQHEYRIRKGGHFEDGKVVPNSENETIVVYYEDEKGEHVRQVKASDLTPLGEAISLEDAKAGVATEAAANEIVAEENSSIVMYEKDGNRIPFRQTEDGMLQPVDESGEPLEGEEPWSQEDIEKVGYKPVVEERVPDAPEPITPESPVVPTAESEERKYPTTREGKPDWDAMDAETASATVMEITKGNKDLAKNWLDARVKAAEKVLEAAKKKTVKDSDDIEAFMANNEALEQEKVHAQEMLDKWKAIRAQMDAPTAEEVEAKRIADLKTSSEKEMKKLGIKVNLCTTIDEVKDAKAKAALEAGDEIYGWFNPNTKEMEIYLPNIKSTAHALETIFHEGVEHYGMPELLGKENFKKVCGRVWGGMEEADRDRFLRYSYDGFSKGTREKLLGEGAPDSYDKLTDEQKNTLRNSEYATRVSADEYMAKIAEEVSKIDSEDNSEVANTIRAKFEKIIESIKNYINELLGTDSNLTRDDIVKLILKSREKLIEDAKKAEENLSEFSLSEDVSHNGKRFYKNSEGSTELVRIQDDVLDAIGIPHLPFKATEDMVMHAFMQHGKQVGAETPEEMLEFIVDVMENFDHVRQGDDAKSFVFSIEEGRKNIGKRAITILLEEDGFIGVKTSGFERINGLQKRQLLWEKGAKESSATGTAPANVTSTQSEQSGQKGGSASNQSNLVSERKVTKNNSNMQISDEENAKKMQNSTENGKIEGNDAKEVAVSVANKYSIDNDPDTPIDLWDGIEKLREKGASEEEVNAYAKYWMENMLEDDVPGMAELRVGDMTKAIDAFMTDMKKSMDENPPMEIGKTAEQQAADIHDREYRPTDNWMDVKWRETKAKPEYKDHILIMDSGAQWSIENDDVRAIVGSKNIEDYSAQNTRNIAVVKNGKLDAVAKELIAKGHKVLIVPKNGEPYEYSGKPTTPTEPTKKEKKNRTNTRISELAEENSKGKENSESKPKTVWDMAGKRPNLDDFVDVRTDEAWNDTIEKESYKSEEYPKVGYSEVGWFDRDNHGAYGLAKGIFYEGKQIGVSYYLDDSAHYPFAFLDTKHTHTAEPFELFVGNYELQEKYGDELGQRFVNESPTITFYSEKEMVDFYLKHRDEIDAAMKPTTSDTTNPVRDEMLAKLADIEKRIDDADKLTLNDDAALVYGNEILDATTKDKRFYDLDAATQKEITDAVSKIQDKTKNLLAQSKEEWGKVAHDHFENEELTAERSFTSDDWFKKGLDISHKSFEKAKDREFFEEYIDGNDITEEQFLRAKHAFVDYCSRQFKETLQRDRESKQKAERERALNNGGVFDHTEQFEKVKQSQDVPKVESKRKFNVDDFTTTDGQRPVLNGVYRENGMMVATDAHALVAIKANYPKSEEGKIIVEKKRTAKDYKGEKTTYEKGQVVEGKYPSWQKVVPELSKCVRSNVDAKDFKNFLAGARQLVKETWQSQKSEDRPSWMGKVGTLDEHVQESRVVLRFSDGNAGLYKLDNLEKFADALEAIGAKEIYYTAGAEPKLVAKTDKGVVLLMPMLPVEGGIEAELYMDADVVSDTRSAWNIDGIRRHFVYDLMGNNRPTGTDDANRMNTRLSELAKNSAAKKGKTDATKKEDTVADKKEVLYTEKIEDFGEHIYGARKDMVREFAKTVENATTQSLVAEPYAKAFKKPDVNKLLKSGAIREQDALYVSAMLLGPLNTQKPKMSKTENWKARIGKKTNVEIWAEKTHEYIEQLGQFLTADDATRDKMIEEWSRQAESGEVTTPNPVYVMSEVLNRIGYTPDSKIDIPNVTITGDGRRYTIEGNTGYYHHLGHHETLDNAISALVVGIKLKNGMTNVEVPANMFKMKGTKRVPRPTGRYLVYYFKGNGISNYREEELPSLEAADKRIAELKEKGKEARKREVVEYDHMTDFRIKLVNPFTGDEFMYDKTFETEDEANEYLQENYEEVNKELVGRNAELLGSKERGKRSLLNVSYVHSNGQRGYVVHYDYDNGISKSLDIYSPFFKTSKEAYDYLAANKERIESEIKSWREKQSKFVFFEPEKKRVGEDYRKGKDVTPEQFSEAFGFRGVQFGNWTNAEDRQNAMNECYDALMDLAHVLKLSPRALSLNGELGMAFGARGSGKFNAHYEPVNVVINLTKTRGAGSLAHEWMHAIDNYFARKSELPSSMVTDVRNTPNMRPELRAAWNEFVDSMNRLPFASRSKGAYWGSEWEKAARLFGEWVVDELAKEGKVNSFLSRGIEEVAFENWREFNYNHYMKQIADAPRINPETGEVLPPMSKEEYFKTKESIAGFPYPEKSETATADPAIRKLFDTMQEKVDENTGNVLLFSRAMDKEYKEPASDNAEELRESETQFSRVRDEKEIERLEKEPKVEAYHAMQMLTMADGKKYLFPPMAAVQGGEYVEGIPVNEDGTITPMWERADEHPELSFMYTKGIKGKRVPADADVERRDGKLYFDGNEISGEVNEDGVWEPNWYFELKKGSKGDKGKKLTDLGKVAYDPYQHSGINPVNDQFTTAYDRSHLVIVKVAIPESEAEGTSGYRAENAKLAVGTHPWKGGVLKTNEPRQVILSRWDKPLEIVSDHDVAVEWKKVLDENGLTEVPFNVVTPAQREELVKLGVKIGEPTNDNAGVAARPAYEEWLKNQPTDPNGGGKRTMPDRNTMSIGEYAKAMAEKKAGETLFSMADTIEKFDKVRDDAVNEKGVIARDFTNVPFKVTSIDTVDTDKSNAELTKDAKRSIVGDYEHPEGFIYSISGESVTKMMSGKSISNSVNRDAHISVLMNMPNVINAGIDVEIHPDYLKVDGVRAPKNGYNESVLMHRLYSAVEVNGVEYRVKTTIKEYRDKNKTPKPYSFEVSNVEVLDPGERLSTHTPVGTILGRDLLNGVTKSYTDETIIPESESKGTAFSSNEQISAQKNAENLESVNSDSQNKEETLFSRGYHAGDLGKADDTFLLRMGGRSTGHFGTGTYFVGDEAKINRFDYAERPHHAVELDEYKLFKPKNADEGFELHNILRDINNKWDEETILSPVKEVRLAQILGVDRAKVIDALDEVREKVLKPYQQMGATSSAWYNHAKTADSASTVFMKALGFEGVDVRDIKELDNTDYGTVVYELHDKDRETLFSRAEEPTWQDKLNDSLGSLSIRDTMLDAVMEGAVKENAESYDIHDRAVRMIDARLADLRKAMQKQKEIDRDAVNTLVTTAKIFLKNGWFDNVSRSELRDALNAIGGAVGKKDLHEQANKLLGAMTTAHVRKITGVFDKLRHTKATKFGISGQTEQAKLDVNAKYSMDSFNDVVDGGIAGDRVDQMISDAMSRMDETSDETAKNMYRHKIAGLMMAKDYIDRVRTLKEEEARLKQDLVDVKNSDYDGLEHPRLARWSAIREVEDAIIANRIEQADALSRMCGQVYGAVKMGELRATAFRQQQIDHMNEIRHFVNSDLKGISSDVHYEKTLGQKIVNSNMVAGGLFSTTQSLNSMLKALAPMAADGHGYMYNHFIPKFVEASDTQDKETRAMFKELDDKVSEVFGKKMSWASAAEKMRNKTITEITIVDKSGSKKIELNQGQAAYLYAMEKQEDGRMKLRAMGISAEDMEAITRKIDPKVRQLMDWVQSDFLVRARNKYNKVHERLFGTAMAANENYFPIRVNQKARGENVQIEKNEEGIGNLSGTVTGAIIERRRNALPLDIMNSDAFSVLIDHIVEMEHWAAFSELNRDANILLSYNGLKNKLGHMTTIHGGGEDLYKNLKNAFRVAVGSYQPQRGTADKFITNVAKGISTSKITLRFWTAAKQILSAPASATEIAGGDGKFMKYYGETLIHPYNTYKWAMDNLPLFEKRLKSRTAGDTRLMDNPDDWKLWHYKVVEWSTKLGMSPNAFVDAMTCARGAYAVYKSHKAGYIKRGFSAEEAEKKARIDASIYYNETQQSNEGAFVSAVQKDQTVMAIGATLFNNANIAYMRRLYEHIDGLKNSAMNHEEQVEYMTKMYIRQGMDENMAKKAARTDVNKSMARDLVGIVLFGYGMQAIWRIGGYIPYLLAGKDDDKKKELVEDALSGGVWSAPLRGTIIGKGLESAMDGRGWLNIVTSPLPIEEDIATAYRKYNGGKHAELITDMFNMIVASGVGIDPSTIGGAVISIVDAFKGDIDTSHDFLLAFMRAMSVPESQVKQVYIDEFGTTAEEIEKMSITKQADVEKLATRYAKFVMMKEAPILGSFRDEIQKQLQMNREANKIDKEVEKRVLLETKENE